MDNSNFNGESGSSKSLRRLPVIYLVLLALIGVAIILFWGKRNKENIEAENLQYYSVAKFERLKTQLVNAIDADDSATVRSTVDALPNYETSSVHALYLAASKGKLRSLNALLTLNINANGSRAEGGPLGIAAYHGNEAVVKMLLEFGAVTDASPPASRTPLCQAALMGNTACVKLLLEHGANPNYQTSDANPFEPGWTPLHFACKSGKAEIVKLLIDKGAKPVQKADNKTPADMLAGKDAQIAATIKALLEKPH